MQANKDKVIRNLHLVQGQLKGIEKMIEENQYCVDISNQLLSSIGLLKKINMDILTAHLNCCVMNATNDSRQEKIEEIINILKRMD
jgi:DNA-binding FrmR family transcriptional regulator